MTRRRKTRKRVPEPEWFHLKVEAASVTVGRIGPKILHPEPEGESSTSITIEGALDRPVLKRLHTAHVTVFERDERTGNPGAAIGGSIIWHVVCDLPRAQFADLHALVLADKLFKVDLLFEGLRRGSGALRSVHFRTAPVPGDAEMEDDS